MTRLALPCSVLLTLVPGLLAQDKVDFAAAIRPIFKERCYACHGPDEQEAGLRLDRRSGVFHGKQSNWVISPGNAKGSTLVARISLPHDDPEIMPPEGERPLAKAQIDAIRAWIDQGADWPEAAGNEAEPETRIEPNPLAVRPMSAAEREREAAARAAIEKRGGLALRIAADTEAVDVNWSLLGKQVVDADLALLEGLAPTLVWLNLSRTSVTDAGLPVLAGLGELRRLNLSQAAVGDAGMQHLAGLAKLEYLNLYDTAVGDAGLAHLHGCKALRKLYLWQSKVTDRGVAALQAALPDCRIDRGNYAELMQRVAAEVEQQRAARQPVNTKCPLTQKPVNLEFTLEHDGELIGFCCGNCKAEFFKDPKQHLAKLQRTAALQPPAVEAPLNERCPVTGKPIDPAFVVEHEGKRIGFCCGNCKAKFEADPSRFKDALDKQPAAPEPERWQGILARVRREFPEVRQVSIRELSAQLTAADGARPLLLDVRRDDEYAVSHLAGARNVPVGEGFVARVRALVSQPDRPIVLYCSVGYRSSRAARELRQAGFADVANLEGSIFAWANAGLPLRNRTGAAATVHPFDREWGELLRPELRAAIQAGDAGR